MQARIYEYLKQSPDVNLLISSDEKEASLLIGVIRKGKNNYEREYKDKIRKYCAQILFVWLLQKE